MCKMSVALAAGTTLLVTTKTTLLKLSGLPGLNPNMRDKLRFHTRKIFMVVDLTCKEVMLRRSVRDLFRPYKLS